MFFEYQISYTPARGPGSHGYAGAAPVDAAKFKPNITTEFES